MKFFRGILTLAILFPLRLCPRYKCTKFLKWIKVLHLVSNSELTQNYILHIAYVALFFLYNASLILQELAWGSRVINLTKVYYRQLAGYQRSVVDHRVG